MQWTPKVIFGIMIQFDMANSKINIKSYCSPPETVDASKVVEHQVKQSSPPNGGEASKLLVTTIYRTSHSSVEFVTAVYTCCWSHQYSTGHSIVKFVVTTVLNLLQGYRTSYSSSVELATA